jgi:antirestriction protein ArdC
MSKKVYQIVTDRIIDALDNGVVPWAKPWQGGYSLPYNMFSMNPDKGKFYRGVNVPLLWMSGHSDPRWMTFTQANKAGFKVKKGEKSSPIVFWKFIEKKDDSGNVVQTIPLLRYFRVYNAQQVEGVPDLPTYPEVDASVNFENCQALIDTYGVNVVHGSNRACYRYLEDKVEMPNPGQFKDVESYWATMLHEAIHSTGHKSRLDRNLDTANRKEYAFEELVAEMGSAFLCAQMGIERDDLTANHASYVAGWKEVLSSDHAAFMRAAKLAKVASEYLLDLTGASSYTANNKEAA